MWETAHIYVHQPYEHVQYNASGPWVKSLTSVHRKKYSQLYFWLNVIYHPLYGMNNYFLIWGD